MILVKLDVGWIASGAEWIEVEGLLSDDVKIAVAANNIAKFVKEMKKEAQWLSLTEMNEKTFAQTLGNLYSL